MQPILGVVAIEKGAFGSPLTTSATFFFINHPILSAGPRIC